MRLRMKNFNIMGVHWKVWLLGGGGGHRKLIYRGNCLKRMGVGGLGQFADLRGKAWQKRGGGVFEGEGDTPMHTMIGQVGFI